MTGDRGIALVIYAAVASWAAVGLGILAMREHHRVDAWRRRARRSAALRRQALAATARHGRRSAMPRGGPKSQPPVVIRCAIRPANPDASTDAAGPHGGDVLDGPPPGEDAMNPGRPRAHPAGEPPVTLTSGERAMLAAATRWARRSGWRNGHRLGWVRGDDTVAVSWQPGVLEVWWRSPAGRWPTYPVAYPVVRVDEAVHTLVRLRLLPHVFAVQAPCTSALGELARGFGLEGQVRGRVVGDDDLERRWRAAAHRPGAWTGSR